MRWKIEHWKDIPHVSELLREYEGLSPRELVIIACASLDTALATVISLRLIDDPAQTGSLLGADGDGRAPAGSMGARIQLAYLLGLIDRSDLARLRAFKALRNTMAHRVAIDLLDPRLQALLEPIRAAWKSLRKNPQADALAGDELDFERSRTEVLMAKRLLALEAAVMEGVLLITLNTMQRLEPLRREHLFGYASPEEGE